MPDFVAVDLGASSGRVMLASVEAGRIDLREVHRFPNRPLLIDGTLQWDVRALWAGVLAGLAIAARASAGGIVGIGVDGWAIDYALLAADGALLANPVHYRDARTDGIAAQVFELIDAAELYAITGVQDLPFNTIYQLVADRDSEAMRQAAHALLIPDLFTFWLTGRLGTELTNASTTGLLDARTHGWAEQVFERLSLRRDLLPVLRRPGDVVGTLLAEVADHTGVGAASVIAVGSHDTASAVAGVPAGSAKFGYISCGTWSLVGVELDAPITTEDAREANFSNELGVDSTVRFLRNVMGLWLLQECERSWAAGGLTIDLPALLAEAARLPARRSVIDPDRREFLPLGDMPQRIRAECRRAGRHEPVTPAEITRCILDSLADAYHRTVQLAAELSGKTIDVIHLVGGGAQNALLCQLTADACGLPVVAGPVEAAAYGNVLVQARTAGVVDGGLDELRLLVASAPTVTYRPSR